VTLIFSWSGGYLVRSSGHPASWYSSDAMNWSSLQDQSAVFGNESGQVDGLAWNGSQLVATGAIATALAPTPTVWSSGDGKTWKVVDTGGSYDPAQELVGLAANATALVGATQEGVVWRSTDGAAWTGTKLPGATDIRVVQVIATSKAFAIVAANGGDQAQVPNKGVTIWSSTDGTTWKSKALTTADWGWERLFVLGDRFVAYEGADSAPSSDNLATRAWVSDDGNEWTSLATPPAGFYVTGSNGALLVAQKQMREAGAPFVLDESTDGIHWSSLPIADSTSGLGPGVGAVTEHGVFIGKPPVLGRYEYFEAVP
jgi:hypothetical protein